jgi:hypothetical protein
MLNATEFVLGVLLLLNVNTRITSWLVLTMMSVFTALTLNDATNNPVPDCGCFGDVLLISNWQTFYKNLVIDALLLIVFLTRGRIPGWFKFKTEWSIVVIAILGFTGFEIYNIHHLPAIDFMDWKVGKKMVNENPVPLEYYLTYRNKETNEEKEYKSPDYPFSDSVWMANWEFVNQRVIDPNPRLHDLHIEDEWGNDYTQAIISNPEFQFLLVSYDLAKASVKRIDRISELLDNCNKNGISFAVLTGTLPADAAKFKELHGLDTDFFFADDVTLMAMIRSNPGLILMKNGVVLDKWHFNDVPAFEDILENYPSLVE